MIRLTEVMQGTKTMNQQYTETRKGPSNDGKGCTDDEGTGESKDRKMD